MSDHPRRILTPGISRKRKEREVFYSFKPSSAVTGPKSPCSPDCSNQLLAGYLAHEFLTRGTLLGQKLDPVGAEMIPIIGSSTEPRKPDKQETEQNLKEKQSYDEVASILKNDGTHVPGIVNPTQLAKWIQM